MYLRRAFFSQAVADAVGSPFEFGNPTREEVAFYMVGRKELFITDDTQMALFSQQGIATGNMAKAYLDWYATQNQGAPTAKQVYDLDLKGLRTEKLMYRREAPGIRCLGALSHLKETGKPKNDGKGSGCGAVMRLLPFTQFLPVNRDKAYGMAEGSASITHRAPEVKTAVDLYMAFAEYMLDLKMLGSWPRTVALRNKIIDSGSGWTALSCVEMAIWAVMNSSNYDQLLLNSICHPGDSDSVAAVAGGLWGLSRRGYEKYLPRLAHKKIIEKYVPTRSVACSSLT